MKKFLIGFVAFAAVLGIGAWVVSVRTKNLPAVSSGSFHQNLGDPMPEFTGITTWINSDPLTAAQLKGKVVLVDFWTYSCINCIRTLPYVTSWQQKYGGKDFTVIGVHTPEFAFEKDENNVREAVKRFNITYPVAMDNDNGTWFAYENEYWPAEYLFDAQGRLRHKSFGEGEYDQTEKEIQTLLKEAGEQADMPLTQATSTPDFGKIKSLETYLGYNRADALGSPEAIVKDAPSTYSIAKNPALNQFYFGGSWTVESEKAVPGQGAKLVYRYSANDANLVLANDRPDGPALRVEVTLDGGPVPEALRGSDINLDESGKTYLLVKDQRLYQITDAKGKYGEHLLQLEFDEPGLSAYAFTFG